MFRINLKRSIATVAVIAGVLAAAGPAGASTAPLHLKGDSNEVAVEGLAATTGFKSLSGMDSETEFMDYTDDALLGVS